MEILVCYFIRNAVVVVVVVVHVVVVVVVVVVVLVVVVHAVVGVVGLGAKSQNLSSVAPPRKKKLVTIFSQ